MSRKTDIQLEETTLAVLKSLPFGVYYCDRNLVVRYINGPYATHIGLQPQEIIGRKITEFIPSSRAMSVMESGREELYQEASVLSERANQRILVNRIPVRNPQGTVIGFISQLMSVGDQGWSDIWHKMEHAERMLRAVPARLPGDSLLEAMARDIVSASPLIRQCVEKAGAYAKTDEPVLITGPTGVGKELFARAIQRGSHRANKPFICINCASISREFINSELFGYAPGAFTGAHRQGKPGLMEMANGGTLFLDEIGDLPLEAQGVLLRALETQQIQRINALEAKEVNFRLISATNKDLWELCRQRLFREDLFFRLSTLPLDIPPLTRRKGDIPLLVRHFLNSISYGAQANMEDTAMTLLQHYAWPGNVRELRNVLVYAAISAHHGTIRPEHLPPYILATPASEPETSPADSPPVPDPGQAPHSPPSLQRSEREAIGAALRQCGGNLSNAARMLGISRTTLYARIKAYGLERRP